MTQTLLCDARDDGTRVDTFLARKLEGIGRRRAALLCAQGAVRINGRPARKSDLLSSNDVVSVELSESRHPAAEPEASLELVLETHGYVVANKPAGMPTCALRPGDRGTLAGALLGRYPEMAELGDDPREAGLIHRLDTQTSGLLIAARTQGGFDRLRNALVTDALDKRYEAIVPEDGLPDSGCIQLPIRSHPRSGRRVQVGRGGRSARTDWRVVRRFGEWALIEVCASRAYRHQVRAHLAAAGHPIAGDRVYGGAVVSSLGGRHALHASYIAWTGDEALEGFAVSAPLPDALAALVGGR